MSQRTLLYAPHCKNNRFFLPPSLSHHPREAMPDCVLFLGRIKRNELSFRQFPHYHLDYSRTNPFELDLI